MQGVGQPNSSNGTTALNAPPCPPAWERDTLGELLEATVFHAVKPYRERFIDILRVIDNTQTGREVLQDFGTLAARGRYPSVDILRPGYSSVMQSAGRAHCLLLSLDALTANAREIGVPPEVDQAPSVLFQLTLIRNTLAGGGKNGHFENAAADGIDVPRDPVQVRARFIDELRARDGVPSQSGTSGAIVEEQSAASIHAGRDSPPLNSNVSGASPAGTSFDDSGTAPLLPVPADEPPIVSNRSDKPSTVSNPYQPVTEDVGIPEEKPPARRKWRMLGWVERPIRLVKNFLLRRGGPDGAGASTGGQAAGSPETEPNKDRPILQEGRRSHRRTQSLRHIRELDPDHGRPAADTPLTHKAKESP